MRMLRLVMPVMVASALLASAASASTQQAAKDRFAQDAQDARIVSAPSTAAASTVTGTVSAKQLGVSSNATAGSVARAAVDRYAGLLGVSNAGTQLRYAQATTDALGQRHVRFDQLAGSVPIYDGAVTVHLARGDALTGFTAGVSGATSGAASQASLDADQARDVALGQVAEAKLVHAPKLYVYTGVPFGSHPATLAWAVDVTSTTRPERKLVFVDAVSGQVAAALDRTEFAKNRTIYNANGSTTTGTFARGEGDPATGNRDVDAAYDWTGATYDYYASTFGRDSYDGAGAELVSFVHYGVGYQNAFWDGAEMVYGDGFAVNDVTAHELTHAVKAHGGPRVPGPARRAERVDLRPGRLGRRPRRLDHGRGPAHRRHPRHAQPRRLRAARHGLAVRLHRQRQRRRAHEQRDPEQGLRQPGGRARAQRRRAGPLPRADRLPRPDGDLRRRARGRAAGGHRPRPERRDGWQRLAGAGRHGVLAAFLLTEHES